MSGYGNQYKWIRHLDNPIILLRSLLLNLDSLSVIGLK